MNIHKATQQYEDWLRYYTPLVEQDLALKHQLMTSGVFPFLRGTYYRWAQRFPKVCSDMADAPTVLAVGDLHVENFGTWRDREGRLVWGVNDFDEAAYLPYTHDVTRLATSAHLAISAERLKLQPMDACEAILAGYRGSLEANGKPFVLAEDHTWLRDVARNNLKDPVTFWSKMDELAVVDESIVPVSARVVVEEALVDSAYADTEIKFKRRVAGVGSLGHPRFVAVIEHEGGCLAREAKALVPSGAVWASERTGPVDILYQAIIARAVRCRDPLVSLHGHWLLRRLAPDCSRIELTALSAEKDEARLLHAMGWETANIHIGDPAPILKDLKKRKEGWLHKAANAMLDDTTEDWTEWKK